MNISEAQKEMDRETVKAILQQVLGMLVRLLGSCPNGGGLLFRPEARENPFPRYLTHALFLMSKVWCHPRARPLPPIPYTIPGSVSPNMTLLPPCRQPA